MLPDRFYPNSYSNSYPPKYKPPQSLIPTTSNNVGRLSTINRYGNMLLGNNQPLIQTRLNKIDDQKNELLHRLIDYLTWTIYISSVVAIISLFVIIPYYVMEAFAIKDGRLIIPDELAAVEKIKESEIKYDEIRTNAAIKSAIVFSIVSMSMFLSSLLIVIGCYYKSYCLTFSPCILLLLPLVAIPMDIYWTYATWFKILALVINAINCSLAYVYSCTIKQREYKSLPPLG